MKAMKMGKRSMGLALAIVLAGVATVALVTYVHGAEARAYAGVQTVSVYVAHDDIPAGTPADVAVQHAAIQRTTVPRKLVADGAIASLSQITGGVAAVTILRGEQITTSRFTTPGQASASGLSIPPGDQAMAVEVEGPPGVGGFVQPGVHVSVIAHVTSANSSSTGNTESVARFVLQDVPVLAVGQQTLSTSQSSGDREAAAKSGASASSSRIDLTLAVTPDQAEKLAYAIFEGDIYFTLLGQDAKPVHTAGRTARTLFQ